jgi:hypothetical protein
MRPSKLQERWVTAENEKEAAAAALNKLCKALTEAWQEYDARKRLAKNLKERFGKRLQKDDK